MKLGWVSSFYAISLHKYILKPWNKDNSQIKMKVKSRWNK